MGDSTEYKRDISTKSTPTRPELMGTGVTCTTHIKSNSKILANNSTHIQSTAKNADNSISKDDSCIVAIDMSKFNKSGYSIEKTDNPEVFKIIERYDKISTKSTNNA